jgi:hypothetical protein
MVPHAWAILPGERWGILMAEEGLVKIWSFEHDAWWRANRCGYTTSEAAAGLYLRSEAEKICTSANYGGKLGEEIVEIDQPSLKVRIAGLIREINQQDNRITASPYYFVVQSKRWVDTAHDGEKEVIHCDGDLYTLPEWLELGEYHTEDTWQEQDPFWLRSEWEDREIFLTEKAALQYMRAQAHHLNEPRTFVKHFWRNSQMKLVMLALEEFSGEKLDGLSA